MILTWSARRKLLYTAVSLLLAGVLVLYVWDTFFTTPPTCTDGIQNGTERGVDCGGACALVCRADSEAPVVLWSRIFPNGAQTYTAAAYIQNKNRGAGAHDVPYLFALYDTDNKLVVERRGTFDIPPVQTVPVVMQAVNVGERTPVRAVFSLLAEPQFVTVASKNTPTLRVSKQSANADGTRADATIINSSTAGASDVVAIAVLFDAAGNAIAASKSTVGAVQPKSSRDIVFTWGTPTLGVVRAEVTVLPSF